MKDILLKILLFTFTIIVNIGCLNSKNSNLLDFYLKSKLFKSEIKSIKIINEITFDYSNNKLISNEFTHFSKSGLKLSEIYYSSVYHFVDSYIYKEISQTQYLVSVNLYKYSNESKELKYTFLNSKNFEFVIDIEENKLTSESSKLIEINKNDGMYEVKYFNNCYLFFNCISVDEKYDSQYRPIFKNFVESEIKYSFTYVGDTTYMDVDFERSPLRSSDQFIVNTKTVKNAKERKVYEEEIFNPDVYNLVEISLLNSFGQDSVTYKMRENDQGKLDTLTIQKYYYEFYDENE